MKKEINEYTMVFDHYERAEDSLYNNIHCRNVRTAKGILIQNNIYLEVATVKRVIGRLSFGEIIVFSAELEFKNIVFKYPHGKR